MREFKFRAWHCSANEMLDSSSQSYEGQVFKWLNEDQPVKIMQFTGLTDKNCVEIYEGDILNICFTSDAGSFIHDGIYVARNSILGAIEFDFRKLMWESHGHNQYPLSSTLCEKYSSLSTVYANDKDNLIVPDKYESKIDDCCDFPFNNHKELSFNSRYFEVIGNIYENQELLEEK